ncbi:MAG: ATP-binding protein [Phycisphaerales bacterium]
MVGEYIQKHEHVLIVGNSGTGKTHLASSLGFTACMQGLTVRFFSVSSLVTHLSEMRDGRQLERTTESTVLNVALSTPTGIRNVLPDARTSSMAEELF